MKRNTITINAKDILVEDLQKLKIELDQAYNEFNQIDSNEISLIDSCIFKINSLNAKHSHLWNQAKKLDPSLILAEY